jgi:hypothetical protein
MGNLRIITDMEECQATWKHAIPQEIVSDIWEFRACFHDHFQRPACFLVARNARGFDGFLPLSWIEESQCYGYFPGETWQGKTWLEQNRIPVVNRQMLCDLLDHCPGRYHLRYLLPAESAPPGPDTVDEVGYLFSPPDYSYDIENYFLEFSNKSAKRLKREINAFEGSGVSYRYDDISDFEHLVQLNVSGFGARSYFHDHRFLEGFRTLMHYLNDKGWLRMTTVIIGGEIAAVDMGCVYRGVYTLLGGGTNRDHPGVAKLINLHHMQRACRERLELVDFLCGDFSWKQLFHLTPRPLYLLSNSPVETHPSEDLELREAGHVQ